MENSELFLDVFNKIESFLKKEGDYDRYSTFTHMVKNSKNSTVKRFKNELYTYGELRNAIVHNPRYGNKTIADPHPETVKSIRNIYELISSPKKLIPTFQFEVLGAKKTDYLNNILKEMRLKSFSQFPVFNEKNEVIEIITNNTISRWMSANIEDNGTLIIDNIKPESLTSHIEYKKNYRFIDRDSSVFDAYEKFIDHINNEGHHLDAIFITQTGKQNETILGIITIEDVIQEIK